MSKVEFQRIPFEGADQNEGPSPHFDSPERKFQISERHTGKPAKGDGPFLALFRHVPKATPPPEKSIPFPLPSAGLFCGKSKCSCGKSPREVDRIRRG